MNFLFKKSLVVLSSLPKICVKRYSFWWVVRRFLVDGRRAAAVDVDTALLVVLFWMTKTKQHHHSPFVVVVVHGIPVGPLIAESYCPRIVVEANDFVSFGE